MATRKKRFPKKKRVKELPDREVIRRIFPKKAVDELDRIAHETPRPEKGQKAKTEQPKP
jgi:hypothetical protein